MVARSRVLNLVSVLSLASVAACAAPSSFDNLSGGSSKPSDEVFRAADPTMGAPRPLSPLSVSWVSTLRPTFKWKTAAGSTGAIVEVCRTRACDTDDVRRFDVDGEVVTVPEDLSPGIWFWRLYGTSKERKGTEPSATWEIAVRGPGAKGASDAPAGGIVDIDGDGYPDLVVTSEDIEPKDEAPEPGVYPDINVWFGGPDGKLHWRSLPISDPWGLPDEDALASGIDTDGDGFTDIAYTVHDRETGERFVGVHYGSAGRKWQVGEHSGIDYLDPEKDGYIPLPGNTIVPGVREGGDVNGDGYGDILVAGSNAALIGLGSAKGTTASMPLINVGGDVQLSNALIGGFDADGDGLSDMAFPSLRAGVPVATLRGDRERVEVSTDLAIQFIGTVEKAIAFASGDFDGDGVADVAATVPIDGHRNVCFWLGNREKMFVAKDCIPGPAGDATYGDRLSSGDLMGIGRDELLVSAGTGDESFVDILGLDGSLTTVDSIDMPGIGSKITTIWPGRPGKARWATVNASRTAILVFEGRTLFQSIAMVGRGFNFLKKVRSIR